MDGNVKAVSEAEKYENMTELNAAEKYVRRIVAGCMLELHLSSIGEDLLVTVQGGERPHIGCTVLSIPRPSLTGDGSMSATSSVLNVVGHKDDYVCREVGEILCKKTGKTVVCTGGVHIDGIAPEQIREILKAVNSMANELSVF